MEHQISRPSITEDLSFEDLMSLFHVHEHKVTNDTSVKIKRLPGLEKPVYISMASKDLTQIKRPAARAGALR